MKKLWNMFVWTMANGITKLLGILIKKDHKVVIAGSWRGKKFADNSRFLFQYLSEKKEELGLSKVIWITNSNEVFENLIGMGYDVVKKYSILSWYYHLKAGTHIICDGSNEDIWGTWSFNAKKVQLWHGIALKNIVFGTNEYKQKREKRPKIVTKLLENPKIRYITSNGGWSNAYYLSPGPSMDDFMRNCFLLSEQQLIHSNMPRNCLCLNYTVQEEKVVSYINNYSKSVLYLPTFRESYEFYQHPLENKMIVEMFEKNNWLWIEKPHPAANDKGRKIVDSKNVLFLDSTFDINVLLDVADLLITDYSSVSFDFLVRTKKVIYYIPDYEYYKNQDRGFWCDFDSLICGEKVVSPQKLGRVIERQMEDGQEDYDCLVKRGNILAKVCCYRPSYLELWEKIDKCGDKIVW